MQQVAIQPPMISANDRLFFTIFIAIIIHSVIILGVTFGQELLINKTPPSLDVIIVNSQQNDTLIENANFISNANQEGGGDIDDDAHPQSPFTAFEQSNSVGIAPIPIKTAAVTSVELRYQDIVRSHSLSIHNVNNNKEKKQEETKDSKEKATFEHDLEMAQLMNKISVQLDQHAKRPKKSFINARTKNSVSAKYMHNWIKKVERIGNLNYPEAARKKDLIGDLVLVVAINQDGSLFNINIRQSSGSSILDQAAKNIVKMASPFKKFTEELKETVDILYITRTWQFKSNKLSSR
jgi:protein TonB